MYVIFTYIGVVLGVNVGIYGYMAYMQCMGYTFIMCFCDVIADEHWRTPRVTPESPHDRVVTEVTTRRRGEVVSTTGSSTILHPPRSKDATRSKGHRY